eukprot:GHVL01015917.1.p1 GENE.GHVL01015917.1~~GHVL01015917.1.p1  ORF type:complete len:1033 (-),score=154.26 GHVL01015917.1:374-3472(-)
MLLRAEEENDPLLREASPTRNWCCSCSKLTFFNSPAYEGRSMNFNAHTKPKKFVPNVVCNQKYHITTFLIQVLYEQFKFFQNLFYLLVAICQFFPLLRTGYLFTFIAPLSFVLIVTISKEAHDDYIRYLRDKEANGQIYYKLTPSGPVPIPSSAIKVGDIIQVKANERVPADLIFLRTSDKEGSTFIRTDQLDGETDWKLRRAVDITQRVTRVEDICHLDCIIQAEPPRKEIYEFVGRIITKTGESSASNLSGEHVDALILDNTLWANAVVASGTIWGIAIYTGKESRATMNTSQSKTKVGLFDLELNRISKILFLFLVVLSFGLVSFKGIHGIWYIHFFKFILLLSSIIPISLRVNLDMAKTYYAVCVMKDKLIPGTTVRTSTIPEELGRTDYLLTDKTGTLTQNDMVFKKLHIGRAFFSDDNLSDLREQLQESFDVEECGGGRRIEVKQVLKQTMIALALCHNVTPVTDDETGEISFQAASPDEMALVSFAASVGLQLIKRTNTEIVLLDPRGHSRSYAILECFPFTSESKRMGIVVEESSTKRIFFFVKGAESVMMERVGGRGTSWLQEECDNFARTGLRTLVIAYKELNDFSEWKCKYDEAKSSMEFRHQRQDEVVQQLEAKLELLALTGVEDRLQDKVQISLEALRQAGVRVWMLTGDKIETAICIAISAGLKSRTQSTTIINSNDVKDARQALLELDRFSAGSTDTVLVVDGKVLEMFLSRFPHQFIEAACKAPAVVCCRCSPTQKAQVVRLIGLVTGCRTCAIGDGGNDVSMIQAAHIGVGIVGKEGKQASLAADYSITQFSALVRLMFIHGRNSYQRSARLAQFVIHRGLIIAFMQGWLIIGYATYYTMAPVFALILDLELPDRIVFMYPELYQSLRQGRVMSSKTFFGWVFISIYQGSVVVIGTTLLFGDSSFLNIKSVAFTSLIMSELLNVSSEVHTWHPLMIAAEMMTVMLYIYSMFILRNYFDIMFLLTGEFFWKVFFITAVSWLPLYIFKRVVKYLRPPQYSKLVDDQWKRFQDRRTYQ